MRSQAHHPLLVLLLSKCQLSPVLCFLGVPNRFRRHFGRYFLDRLESQEN